jgi:primosomal protein N' (replication factor Y)
VSPPNLPAGSSKIILFGMRPDHINQKSKKPTYAIVALPIPVDRLFTYAIPPELAEGVRPGVRVEVPLGRRTTSGIVIELTHQSDVGGIRPIKSVGDTHLSPALMKLTDWVASYYGCTFGEAAQSVIPPSFRQAKVKRSAGGFARLAVSGAAFTRAEEEVGRAPKQLRLLHAMKECGGAVEVRTITEEWGFSRTILNQVIKKTWISIEPVVERSHLGEIDRDVVTLNTDQELSVQQLIDATGSRTFSPFLLYGVTGSGKTEVYLRAARHVIVNGGGCIVLVPEISLLPQAIARYRKHFQNEMAVVHSRMTGPERYDAWKRMVEGECRLVLGPRSAVFSPIQNLRLIIVDEEQDDSYKQGEKPRYHARHIALMRGKFEDLTVVLGSATPSAESYEHTHKKRYTRLELPDRVEGVPMPRIDIVDMKVERVEGTSFSKTLLDRLKTCLGSGGQSILFLNKRGHARYVQCSACGWVAQCKHCDISLTFHRIGGTLRCHFCGFSQNALPACPECSASRLFFTGVGTQRIELDLQTFFPGVAVLRMDADTTSGKEGHLRILEKFASGSYSILLGTQMVTKGHHFPGVQLVGVLNAEDELNFPDFRSAERTFQQLTQVSGRAGRVGRRGEVVVQTYMPDHYVFSYLKTNDYDKFMNEELKVRKLLKYPPYSRLVSALCISKDKELLERVTEAWALTLRRTIGRENVAVLGPTPPIIERLKGSYRLQVMVKGHLTAREKRGVVERFNEITLRMKTGRAVDLRWDVDPQSFY